MFVFPHQRLHQFGLFGSVLDILPDGIFIFAKIEKGIFPVLDRPARRRRTDFQIQAVCRAIVGSVHGAEFSSGKALGTVPPSDCSTTRRYVGMRRTGL